MSKRVDGSFTIYEFTDQEVNQARIFSTLQKEHIQTELAICAEERANLPVDHGDVNKYHCELEFIRGKMEALRHLLNVSDFQEASQLEELQEVLNLGDNQ